MAVQRLGRIQHEIMRILWRKQKATAREITEELNRSAPIAHSTVQTLLRKLERKGAVSHEAVARLFVFKPLFREAEVTTTAAKDLLNRVFQGSAFALAAHLLKYERISDEE